MALAPEPLSAEQRQQVENNKLVMERQRRLDSSILRQVMNDAARCRQRRAESLKRFMVGRGYQ
jgi:hypothetical protein